MFKAIQRVLSVSELKSKILFTLLLLAVCRVGGFIPVPGINGELAMNYFKQTTGGSQNIFQLVDIFSGGAFSQMTVIALGVIPYITASIILQLFVALSPSLTREIQENGQLGRRKINRYTRYLTILLSVMQSGVFAKYAIQMNQAMPGIINSDILTFKMFGMPILFFLVVIASMTTGTMLLMWLGEQITENGIGNGVSLIISLGILSALPGAIGMIIQQLNLDSQAPGQMNFAYVVVLLALFVLVTMGTILIIQGTRKIPVQYARRVVGRHEVQGQASYLPLKVNYAGVIPIIFASSLLMFPATMGQFVGNNNFISNIANAISPGSTVYIVLYVGLIILLTYFWTATQFKPDQIASDMKKNGAFIPGVRQGKPTQDYLEGTMSRITFIGSIFLAAVAVLPMIIGRLLAINPTISYFFGGTALLILVGVVLDTMKQVESHLLMKSYEGFMKRGRIKGR